MKEGNSKKSLEKRKEKIRLWLNNKNNLYLLAILIFAFIIRLYYFSQTLNQPLWWDEAEYMNMARAWVFNLDYEFLPVRPILFSLITALFFKISYSEFLPRLLVLILSLASIVGMYYLGKEIFDRKVGLLSAFLMSIFYLNLFYSFRLLGGIPSLTFFIFSALFFYKYFKTRSNKMLYIGSVMIAISTLLKITSATFLFAILIYVLITDRFRFIKRKEIWISSLIFILILSPYLIWGYMHFNGFVITQAGAWNAPQDNRISNGFCNLKSYFSMLTFMLSWPFLIIFIFGLFIMYELILGFDVLIKGEDFNLNKYLYLFLLFILPILSVSFSIAACHHEDRYIIDSFPAIFIISSIVMIKFYNWTKNNKRKYLGILLIILLLGFLLFYQLQYSDRLIKSKLYSYQEAKESGIWMRENSLSSDIIFTSSWPMTGYYSERKIIALQSSKEKVLSEIENNPNAKYFMLSAFQKSPNWTYTYPQENNLSIAKAYFADTAKKQPIVVIYNLK